MLVFGKKRHAPNQPLNGPIRNRKSHLNIDLDLASLNIIDMMKRYQNPLAR